MIGKKFAQDALRGQKNLFDLNYKISDQMKIYEQVCDHVEVQLRTLSLVRLGALNWFQLRTQLRNQTAKHGEVFYEMVRQINVILAFIQTSLPKTQEGYYQWGCLAKFIVLRGFTLNIPKSLTTT